MPIDTAAIRLIWPAPDDVADDGWGSLEDMRARILTDTNEETGAKLAVPAPRGRNRPSQLVRYWSINAMP
jgi:hypothetical protein